jgi:hypothetical protein
MGAGANDGERIATEIRLERLNYGKLALEKDLRIPTSEGYGVTLRSSGLDPSCDRALLPPRLLGVRRLDQELFDERAGARGAFLMRLAPDWPLNTAAPAILLRARFRSEDGENGCGRLYQQSAIWAADFETWRRYPAQLLAVAQQELEARPDLLRDSASARFSAAPLHRCIEASAGGALGAEAIAAATRMLDALFAGADALFTFGDDALNERQFFAAAGLALQCLPEDFPRWPDISLLCGLRHALPGLCLRFLPSWREPASVSAAA